jgi:hypothetical protein
VIKYRVYISNRTMLTVVQQGATRCHVQADMAVRDVIVGHHYIEDGSSVADAFQQEINVVDAPLKDAYALVVGYIKTL